MNLFAGNGERQAGPARAPPTALPRRLHGPERARPLSGQVDHRRAQQQQRRRRRQHWQRQRQLAPLHRRPHPPPVLRLPGAALPGAPVSAHELLAREPRRGREDAAPGGQAAARLPGPELRARLRAPHRGRLAQAAPRARPRAGLPRQSADPRLALPRRRRAQREPGGERRQVPARAVRRRQPRDQRQGRARARPQGPGDERRGGRPRRGPLRRGQQLPPQDHQAPEERQEQEEVRDAERVIVYRESTASSRDAHSHFCAPIRVSIGEAEKRNCIRIAASRESFL